MNGHNRIYSTPIISFYNIYLKVDIAKYETINGWYACVFFCDSVQLFCRTDHNLNYIAEFGWRLLWCDAIKLYLFAMIIAFIFVIILNGSTRNEWNLSIFICFCQIIAMKLYDLFAICVCFYLYHFRSEAELCLCVCLRARACGASVRVSRNWLDHLIATVFRILTKDDL